MPPASACPNCQGTNLYTRRVASAGGHGPAFLPGLGGFLRHPQFDAVICGDCGLTRLFAEPSARAKLPDSPGWRPVGAGAVCPACGYDLRASPGRCPECGAVPATAPRGS